MMVGNIIYFQPPLFYFDHFIDSLVSFDFTNVFLVGVIVFVLQYMVKVLNKK